MTPSSSEKGGVGVPPPGAVRKVWAGPLLEWERKCMLVYLVEQ